MARASCGFQRALIPNVVLPEFVSTIINGHGRGMLLSRGAMRLLCETARAGSKAFLASCVFAIRAHGWRQQIRCRMGLIRQKRKVLPAQLLRPEAMAEEVLILVCSRIVCRRR